MASSSWAQLAHLLRPQGRRGEVLAELLTDFPERFTAHPDVFLAPEGFDGAPQDARTATVTGHWLPVGRNRGRVVLAFAGIDSIEAAERLAGLSVLTPDSARVELEEDAEYIDDLVGCVVCDMQADGPLRVGTVEGVDFALTPDGSRRLPGTAPLLRLRTDAGDEVLIPYVRDFLVRLAVEERRIEMKLPAGLIELNLRPGPPSA